MHKNRIKELTQQLNKARNEYYNNNSDSVMSDAEYDLLFDELKNLEETTGFIMTNSPTQNVGYTAVSKLRKVKHDHPMLSLAKTTNIEEMEKFIDGKPIVTMLKEDGLTCSLCYENGKLVSAETRGNGERGIDISPAFMDFRKFYEWSISNGYQVGLQIDRIDNNLGYSETNCRWVTPTMNMRNKRDNRMINAFGQTKTLSEWCEIFNMGRKTIVHRIDKQGMIPEVALTTKTRKGHYPNIPTEYQQSIIH